MDLIRFVGRGLHSGGRTELCLRRGDDGPVLFHTDHGYAAVSELSVVRTDRGVQVEAPSIQLSIDLVEHLLAALAGLSVYSGIVLDSVGGEIPLLDGGALELALALQALDPPRTPPSLRVVKHGEIEVGGARYSFEPGDSVELEVEVDFPGVGIQRARFDGAEDGFLRDIAPARTFGFRSEEGALKARGRARYVDPNAVLVLEDDGRVLPPARPAQPDELARHKLLDLMGDLYLYGGPPRGRTFARRPGHGASHEAVAQALGRGLLAPLG